MNDPTGSSRSSAYFDAMRDLDEAIDDGLDAIRAEQDEGRLGLVQAAAERVTLLERHLVECRRLRRELLGGPL